MTTSHSSTQCEASTAYHDCGGWGASGQHPQRALCQPCRPPTHTQHEALHKMERRELLNTKQQIVRIKQFLMVDHFCIFTDIVLNFWTGTSSNLYLLYVLIKTVIHLTCIKITYNSHS